MSIIEEGKIFYVDSNKRTYGSHSSFGYQLKLDKNNQYDTVCVLEALIPKSYYMVHSQNGSSPTILLKEHDGSTEDSVSFNIEEGNYSRRSIMVVVQEALNNNSVKGWTYLLSYNTNQQPDTGKINFTITASPFSQVSLTFYDDGLAECLGFNQGENIFTSTTFTSTSVIRLQRENALYIHSNLVNNGSSQGNAILQEIYASAGDSTFSNIKYTCPDIHAYSKPLSNNTSDHFNFALTDEDGDTPIELHGQSIHLAILIYKKVNINKMLKSYIKYKLLNESKK